MWKLYENFHIFHFQKRIVSAETILFLLKKMWKFSYSFCIMAIFYFMNWIDAAETIEGGNYSRKYGRCICGFMSSSHKKSCSDSSNIRLLVFRSQNKMMLCTNLPYKESSSFLPDPRPEVTFFSSANMTKIFISV